MHGSNQRQGSRDEQKLVPANLSGCGRDESMYQFVFSELPCGCLSACADGVHI